MTSLTLGSLFDGSGGFPLGGMLAGITPVWASEIEPFPIRVTTKRMPFMKHYGDVSAMDGGKVEPVDIITFGSPCQDMSVAGKRTGLEGSRSSLFYEAIRIIKEMRCATNGKYPRYAVWENVPGAFSSSDGEDFRTVLEALCSIKNGTVSLPRPERWPHAGEILGDGFSLAWRLLDAQYWGVPQRRKRIYLVADFAGRSAGQVLFESEGLSGYSAESFRAWQRAAGDSASCSGVPVLCLNDQGGQRMDVSDDMTGTLRAEARGHIPAIVMFENHSQDTRYTGPVETAPTVSSTYGTGGNNQPFVVDSDGNASEQDTHSNAQTVVVPFAKGTRPHSADEAPTWKEGRVANTLNTHDVGEGRCGELAVAFGNSQGGTAIAESYAIQGNMIGRDDKNGIQGKEISRDVLFTLNATDKHAVYALTTGSFLHTMVERSPTLTARDYKDPTTVAYDSKRYTFGPEESVTAKEPDVVKSGYTVRRLTPTECARLQGFPDWWCSGLGTEKLTDEELYFWYKVFENYRKVTNQSAKPKSSKQVRKWLRDPCSDSAEYKMWGNGVALPCVFFVMAGIAYYAQLS